MSYYFEIMKALSKFCNDNIDKLIGNLTLNEVSQLADEIDNEIRQKIKLKYEVKK